MKFPPTIGLRLKLLHLALAPGLSSDAVGRAVNRFGGSNYRDICANETPFDLVWKLSSQPGTPFPDFSAQVEPPASFAPPNLPAYYNSEPSVVRFLAQLVFLRQPRNVLEIGCFVGWASVHMALALKARSSCGHLHCVDISPEALSAARANFVRHDVGSLATTYLGNSLDPEVLAKLPAKADMIFIDSSHRYPETLHEITAYAPRLAPGGCIVLHDSISFPGVRQSLAELGNRFQAHTFATECSNGITVLTPDNLALTGEQPDAKNPTRINQRTS